jgi:hypothetical protein
MMKRFIGGLILAIIIIIFILGCGSTEKVQENKKPKWYELNLIKIERSQQWLKEEKAEEEKVKEYSNIRRVGGALGFEMSKSNKH